MIIIIIVATLKVKKKMKSLYFHRNSFYFSDEIKLQFVLYKKKHINPNRRVFTSKSETNSLPAISQKNQYK